MHMSGIDCMQAKKLPEKKKVDRKIGQEGCEQGRHRPAANICLDDGKRSFCHI